MQRGSCGSWTGRREPSASAPGRPPLPVPCGRLTRDGAPTDGTLRRRVEWRLQPTSSVERVHSVAAWRIAPSRLTFLVTSVPDGAEPNLESGVDVSRTCTDAASDTTSLTAPVRNVTAMMYGGPEQRAKSQRGLG